MKSLTVLASGMVTALGFNSPATLAALRAGVSAVQQSPWLDPESGEPLMGAKVGLPQWWEGVGKLAELVAPAISECRQSALAHTLEEIPILLGVAERERPARTQGREAQLLQDIQARLGVPLHPESSIYAGGQTACIHALQRADDLLAAGRARVCIVAGVDSYLQQPTLDSYAERRRLMTRFNSNGFFPGEAACALLVSTDRVAAEGTVLRILGFGSDQEPATIDSTKPLRAAALTNAVKQSLTQAGIELKDVNYRLTDLSGEHYKFKEAAFAAMRLDRGERDEPLQMWHPIEYLGEIGSAIVPCLLAWALHAHQNAYAPGPIALCHVGNEAGERCALVLRCD